MLLNDAPGHVLIYLDISKLIYLDISKNCKIESESKFYFMYTGTYIYSLKKKLSCRGAMDEKVLADAIKMTNVAFNLCLSNKFVQAQAKLEPW